MSINMSYLTTDTETKSPYLGDSDPAINNQGLAEKLRYDPVYKMNLVAELYVKAELQGTTVRQWRENSRLNDLSYYSKFFAEPKKHNKFFNILKYYFLFGNQNPGKCYSCGDKFNYEQIGYTVLSDKQKTTSSIYRCQKCQNLRLSRKEKMLDAY